jgi:hypothetical protein
MYAQSECSSTVTTSPFIERLSFVGYNGSPMASIDLWRPPYLAAMFETDDSRMMIRIVEARAAIQRRLLLPIDEDGEEYRAIKAAQKALDVLKSERVDNTGQLG